MEVQASPTVKERWWTNHIHNLQHKLPVPRNPITRRPVCVMVCVTHGMVACGSPPDLPGPPEPIAEDYVTRAQQWQAKRGHERAGRLKRVHLLGPRDKKEPLGVFRCRTQQRERTRPLQFRNVEKSPTFGFM